MKFLDRDHPFFVRPAARWIATIAPLVWGGIEVWLGNPGWGVLFGVAGLLAGWELFIRK